MHFFEGFGKACSQTRIVYLALILIIFAVCFAVSGELYGNKISSDIISGNYVDLNNKKINGDIVVTNASICQKLIIENSEINGNVVFDQSLFNNDVSFANTTIMGQSSFVNSIFNRVSKFNRSYFRDRANFENATFTQGRFEDAEFSGDAVFSYCKFINKPTFGCAIFNKDAIFRNSNFKKSDFSNVHFKGIAFFPMAAFGDATYFNSAIMSDEANFYNVSFHGVAVFSDLKASNKVDFSNAVFSRMADFTDSRFGGYTDFYKAEFQEEAHFSNLKASSEVDFSRSNFSQKADFRDTRFNGYVNFKNASFKNLTLNGAILNQFYLPWKNVKGKLDCDEYLYLRMINTYKDMGLFDDADDCYYYFKNNYHQSYIFSDCIESILGELYGWGVKPLNTIKWSIIFILIFGLYFWLPYILTDAHCTEGRSDTPGTKYSGCRPNGSVQSMELHAGRFFDAAKSTCLSLIISLILSARIFASALTSTIDGPSMNGSGRNIAKLEKLLAHLMAFLFLIAISKTILREII